MRDIYFSIDLDYWAKFNSTTDADSFFDQVFNLKLPCHIVASHEQLLPYIKTSKCRHVYNVDYHSDLADFGSRPNEGKESLSEGNWVNYVNFRHKGGEYIWFAPSKDNFKIDNGAKRSSYSPKRIKTMEYIEEFSIPVIGHAGISKEKDGFTPFVGGCDIHPPFRNTGLARDEIYKHIINTLKRDKRKHEIAIKTIARALTLLREGDVFDLGKFRK